MNTITKSFLALSLVLSPCCVQRAHAQQIAADAIYAGGPIITMNDAAPRAEAVAVKDGRIIAVGTKAEVE
jgi:hypothetical protein